MTDIEERALPETNHQQRKATAMEINGEKYIRAADIDGGQDPLDPAPGDKIIVRTVTMTLTGEVVACSPTWLLLDRAAWIADSGRWADALATGSLSEVEPIGDGVRVARAAVVDVAPWRHDLPTVQR